MQTIIINEVGLRDGLQSISTIMPTADKCKWINLLYDSGIRHMEVASFVPAKHLPQMADAAEVVAHALTYPDLTVTALVPNIKGAINAFESGVHRIIAPISASTAHSLANVRKTPLEMVDEFAKICELRDSHSPNTVMIAGISVAFGCTLQGDVPLTDLLAIVQQLDQTSAESISLADTTGYATPAQVAHTIQAVRDRIGNKLTSMHFHDTRGMALVNSLIAIQQGITELDASFAGLGGCPHAPGASGNTVTEDLVYMLESMGYHTGIDLTQLLPVREFLQHSLPDERLYGSIYRAGLPLNYTDIVTTYRTLATA